MWTVQTDELTESRGRRFTIAGDSRPATFGDVILAWQHDADFRSLFNSLVADTPFTAMRWETPAVTAKTLSQSFEFVLLDSPGLDRRPDPSAFAQHFAKDTDAVAVFPNLGGDAILIVPYPLVDPLAYGHLAAFVRSAPEHQRHALWQAVGAALARRVGVKPVWLSTAGAGVPWLHVRLDDRPKYYGFNAYRQTNA